FAYTARARRQSRTSGASRAPRRDRRERPLTGVEHAVSWDPEGRGKFRIVSALVGGFSVPFPRRQAPAGASLSLTPAAPAWLSRGGLLVVGPRVEATHLDAGVGVGWQVVESECVRAVAVFEGDSDLR